MSAPDFNELAASGARVACLDLNADGLPRSLRGFRRADRRSLL